MSLEKLKTMLMQNFGEQTRCIMGDVKVANGHKTNVLCPARLPTHHEQQCVLVCHHRK